MKKTHSDSLAPEDKEQVELADIFRRYADDYRQSHTLSYEQLKVMGHIEKCRTAKLGGHVEQCDQCGFERIAYNSCRDRHCLAAVISTWYSPCHMTLIPLYYPTKKRR
jgi:predicted Zn-ribbon and HTH transcriptional regulator